MHTNFYFLRQLGKSLETVLAGTVISECFSQNKEELVIRFETRSIPFFIRCSLESGFNTLSFPPDFHRARKNSVDLFEEIIGRRVQAVHAFKNERSLALVLSDDFLLVFKMHGSRSNLLLFEKGQPARIFRNNIEADKTLVPETLDRNIDFTKEAFLQHIGNLKGLYVTFGKIIWSYLDDLGFSSQPVEKKWLMIQALLEELNAPSYYLLDRGGIPVLSLVDAGNVIRQFDTPIAAANDFFHTFIQAHAFRREKEQFLAQAMAKLRSSENYLEKTEQKLKEIESDISYKTWADLLMANLHAVKTGSDQVILTDFVSEKPITIKLKRDLSPQKNAEIFYKKSKNQHIEIGHLKKSIADKKREMEQLQSRISVFETAADLNALRNATVGERTAAKKESKDPVPYHEVVFNGYRIWIGRNAQNNDVLTFKYAFKDDVWLHAKDVAGSHVIIKYQSGKKTPKDVIERAAQHAAYHSKRKNESLCPVSVTSRKYVRKRKGDPAGMVVVEREDVILVEPLRS